MKLNDYSETEFILIGIQHREPVVNSIGELLGYYDWRDGPGLAGWPQREIYAKEL